DHMDPNSVSLVLPVPFGAAYKATSTGFTVRMKHYPYADGAKLLGSDLPFADFMTALDAGTIVLNIHTDKFHDGAISGDVVRSPAAATYDTHLHERLRPHT